MSKDLEKRWDEAVREASSLVKNRKHNQMRIALLALEVCEITRGGVSKGLFTMKKFAEEISITPRQLSTWINIRKNVFNKLDADVKEMASFTNLDQVARIITASDSREKVNKMVREICGRGELDAALIKYLANIRGIVYNFQVKNAANKARVDVLEELLFYSQEIVYHIGLRKSGKIKPQDNGLTSKYNKGYLSANNALEGKIGRMDTGFGETIIKEKEQRIIDFMKSGKGKLFSPTEIGQIVGKHNKSSASAWAYRSLQKLISVDLVERTPKGLYRLAEA